MASKIQWTDEVWNPTVGCSKVSDGCRNCYAIRQAERNSRFEQTREAYAGLTRRYPDGSVNWTGEVRSLVDRLEIPTHWVRPRRVFVNSMSDLFHERVSDEFIVDVFNIMAQAGQHTFQILTKRPDRMFEWCETYASLKFGQIGENANRKLPLPNVWLGVSAENQDVADERIPQLLNTPAAIRFVSAEPLLGPIEFQEYGPEVSFSWLRGFSGSEPEIPGLDWVITGAESGPGATPMQEDWVRYIRDQCVDAGVAFFYKQNAHNGHKIPTPELDGIKWTQYPA